MHADPGDWRNLRRRHRPARWRALGADGGVASAIATITMRHQLTESLGVRWRRGRSGSWEIDGIDDDVEQDVEEDVNDAENDVEDGVDEVEDELDGDPDDGDVDE